ncbi:hypothetical protein MO327_00630 [Xanthomonas translucens]|uniref:hypothetical protein n=1 Tax=Xanthomonas campestris pv. translucens TaxID=343 RepID=UPI00272DA28C|nr:hypothetical protein [Xanthomonas translucens]WLA12476.1 hypothetical protein MO327_00630 [Xanthomonas translucens]
MFKQSGVAMQTLKKILTCSSSFTSPPSPTSPSCPLIQRDAKQGSDHWHVRAASGDSRLEALAEKPIRPYMHGVLEGDLPSAERDIRGRIKMHLLPKINDLVEDCKDLENGNFPEYATALDLQNQLEKRSRGVLIDEGGERIEGCDELEKMVGDLEKKVDDYFTRNPGTHRPTLRPALTPGLLAANAHVQLAALVRSNWSSVPEFVPKTALVTRRGSHAQIKKEVMKAALRMVKVDDQTSKSMEDEKNVLNTKVGNFLEAIRQGKDVNILAVVTAKQNNENATDLVNALKNLIKKNPQLPML